MKQANEIGYLSCTLPQLLLLREGVESLLCDVKYFGASADRVARIEALLAHISETIRVASTK